MRLLSLIPTGWLIAGEVALAGALVAAVGLQTNRLRLAQERQGRAVGRAVAAEASASAAGAALETYRQRLKAQQDTIDATEPQLTAARAAAALLPDLDRRVRDATVAVHLCGRAGAADPGAAQGSPPADEAGRVLTELQRRAQEAEAIRARFADEAAAAGERCERIGDSLSGR
jgi:hypothetical protein